MIILNLSLSHESALSPCYSAEALCFAASRPDQGGVSSKGATTTAFIWPELYFDSKGYQRIPLSSCDGVP